MAMFSGRIVAGRKLPERLAALPAKVQKKGGRVGTRNAMKYVLALAKRYVPHDEGNLEASLAVRSAKSARGGRLRRGTIGHEVATREGFFAGEEFYGGFIESGTKDRHAYRGGKLVFRGRVEADSFARRALWENPKKLEQIYWRHVWKALTAEAMKR